jgi:hypothetical protein
MSILRIVVSVLAVIGLCGLAEAKQYCAVDEDCRTCSSDAFKQWQQATSSCGQMKDPTKCRADLLDWHARAKAACARQAQAKACERCDSMSGGGRNQNACRAKAAAATQGMKCSADGECRRGVEAAASKCTGHCHICRDGLEVTTTGGLQH